MSCSQKAQTPGTPEVTQLREGDGEIVKSGQFLIMDVLFQDDNDSIWHDTRTNGFPMIFFVRDDSLRVEEDYIEDIFCSLSKRDSVSFDLTAKQLFEKTWRTPTPPEVDTASIFTFYVGVRDVVDSTHIDSLRKTLEAKSIANQLEKDTKIIDDYLAENNIEAKKTPSGLRYQILKEGVGETIKSGQEIDIHYAGYLINDVLFDTSIDSIAKGNNQYNKERVYEPISFVAGEGQVIAGWDEATLLLKKHSKMRVWIPSYLAYGPRRRSALIAENAILVFNMEVMDIK